ncbi:hypothetical protein [Ructibacterium gallinarum]|uniref:Glycoside Hydrolase 20C C-terminal domain-containing protein n=1 Tax=Ructibacterium gallinarum TaxID=2779355 RepID=A0A9D5M6U5_9FIRM|nr:hypothetical protein [Ructibacterium gallinarum]MBE5040624.1 hypothetical protein [Ructibacterium gallinarum]
MPVTLNAIVNIQKTVWDLLDFKDQTPIKFVQRQGAYVKIENGAAWIGGSCISEYGRAFALYAQYVSEGIKKCEIFQKPSFRECGVMIETSLNTALRPAAIKIYINHMAMLGMNFFLFSFAWGRAWTVGKYIEEELIDLAHYAASLGIEMVPCISVQPADNIQLGWKNEKESGYISSDWNDEIFLQQLLCLIRRCFRSERIYIKVVPPEKNAAEEYLELDDGKQIEAMQALLWKLYQKSIYHGLSPVLWADPMVPSEKQMFLYDDFIRAAREYKLDAAMICANGSCAVQKDFSKKILAYSKQNVFVSLASGEKICRSFLPDCKQMIQEAIPALDFSVRKGINTVFAVIRMTGECTADFMYFLPYLMAYSEYCYAGIGTAEEKIYEMSRFFLKREKKEIEYFSFFQKRKGTELIWCDPFVRLFHNEEELKKTKEMFQQAYQYFSSRTEAERNEYAALLFKVAKEKCELCQNLFPAYYIGDRNYLWLVAEDLIPRLQSDYEELHHVHKQLWRKNCMTYGWEILDGKYGAMHARLASVGESVLAYLNEEISQIEELTEKGRLEQNQNFLPALSGFYYMN